LSSAEKPFCILICVNMKKSFYFIIITLILLKLFLVRNQPIFALVGTVQDDQHYINQATWLLKGNWLGPYDQYTLIKGPFFPIWIACTFLLGIPFLLSEHLVYIVACLTLIIAIKPVFRRNYYALILFFALLFNPFTYDTKVFTRVVRDGVYTSLCILVISCALGLFIRRKELSIKNLYWAFGLGLSFSAAALTREDNVWLLPPLLIVFVIYLIGLRNTQRQNIFFRLGAWGLASTVYFVIVGLVSLINYKYYSFFNITEMAAPEFVAAYSALQRVVPEQFVPMVPVSKGTRRQIYAVSPAFEELEPFLEGDLGKGWANSTIPGMDLPKGEIIGGWFIWAFRDAVAAAGHYGSGQFPANYYRTLVNQINVACNTGKLSCISKPTSLAPAWNNAYLMPTITRFINGISLLLVPFSEFNPYPLNSSDSQYGQMQFEDLTQNEISVTSSANRWTIRGWAFNVDKEVRLFVTNMNGDYVQDFTVDYLPSSDVYNYFFEQGKDFPTSKFARFDISTSCIKTCFLEVRSGDELLERIRFSNFKNPMSWNDSKTFIYIDSEKAYVPNVLYFQNKYNNYKMRILYTVGRCYQIVFPYATMIAALILVLLTTRVNKHFDTWVIAALWFITVMERVALLAYIDVASFPALTPLYLTPAYPFMIAFTFFLITYAIDCAIESYRKYRLILP